MGLFSPLRVVYFLCLRCIQVVYTAFQAMSSIVRGWAAGSTSSKNNATELSFNFTSRDCISLALSNSGFKFPMGRTAINLTPADAKKEGPSFDLPIALGRLGTCEQIVTDQLDNFVIMSDLALNGTIRSCRGILPVALRAHADGKSRSLAPMENDAEAAVIEGLQVIPVPNLRAAAQFGKAKSKLPEPRLISSSSVRKTKAMSWISPKSKARKVSSARWNSRPPPGITGLDKLRHIPALFLFVAHPKRPAVDDNNQWIWMWPGLARNIEIQPLLGQAVRHIGPDRCCMGHSARADRLVAALCQSDNKDHPGQG